MSAPQMKLYSTQSGWNTAKSTVETALGLSGDWPNVWGVENRVRPDHPTHADKWILPLHTSGQFKCDHLFASGKINWNPDLFIVEEQPE